jgi:integrase
MPLYLRPPREGKNSNYEVRGKYLGVVVGKSTETNRKDAAEAFKRKVERCIEEHGCYPEPKLKIDKNRRSFLDAAVQYMESGGNKKYVDKLINHFGETPLADIDQDAVDAAALVIYPGVTPATRARQCYTVISAIMHHALGDKAPMLRRPKGSKGKKKTDFMWPEDCFAIIEEADKIDSEFGLYLRLLISTGIRKSEGLKLLSADIRPEERAAWLRTSKNGDPRMLRLRQDLMAPLIEHLKTNAGERLFRFKDGGWFKHLLMRSKLAACGIQNCPKSRPIGWKVPAHRLSFVGFHCFRHSWATWMRMYAGADIKGLVATGNWRDEGSASRYSHVVPRDEWNRVEDLPGMPATGKGRGKAA